MNIIELREFCLALPATEEGLPFDDKILVFSIYGKMFCLTNIDEFDFINVKCDPDKAILLREQFAGVSPGFHMNKKHWNNVTMDGTVPDKQIREWIKDSYDLVASKLPQKIREKLNFKNLF